MNNIQESFHIYGIRKLLIMHKFQLKCKILISNKLLRINKIKKKKCKREIRGKLYEHFSLRTLSNPIKKNQISLIINIFAILNMTNYSVVVVFTECFSIKKINFETMNSNHVLTQDALLNEKILHFGENAIKVFSELRHERGH